LPQLPLTLANSVAATTDASNRDGVQTPRICLAKLQKTRMNLFLNEMGQAKERQLMRRFAISAYAAQGYTSAGDLMPLGIQADQFCVA